MKLKIEYVPLKDLLPYAYNARLHSEAQVAQIKASMQEFGFIVPCLIDAKGELITGHGRLMAATQLGLDVAPIIRVGHLNEEQIRAFRIADNRITLNSDWDIEKLNHELAELMKVEFDIDVLGFNEAELEAYSDMIGLDVAADMNEVVAQEWRDMPEFAMADKEAFLTLPVHFKDQAAVDAFAKLIGQKIDERTRYLWYPNKEIELMRDKRYSALKPVSIIPEADNAAAS